MVIGAIVVMIILAYAYVEVTTARPASDHFLKIKKDLNVNLPELDHSVDILVNYKYFRNG